MDCSTPGFPVFHHLLELAQIMSIESVMPFSHLIFRLPLLFLAPIFPSIRVFSNELALAIRWPRYWRFSISPSNEYSRLISFWSPCTPRDSQESSPAPQCKSISSSTLSFLYSPALTSIHNYWKNHNFDYMDFCQQSDVSYCLGVSQFFFQGASIFLFHGCSHCPQWFCSQKK